MTEEQALLFRILQASLWSGKSVLSDQIIPNTIFEELRNQTVDGLVAAVIPKMESDRYLRAARFAQMIAVQNETIHILHKAGIPLVILKGTASGIYYPQPYLRRYGDVDILVHPGNYQQAVRLLSENGFAWSGSFGEIETQLSRSNFAIEVHCSVSGLDRLPKSERQFIQDSLLAGLEEAQIGKLTNPDCEFPMLPWEQNGLELIWHIREHLYNGLGLRQIIDWMMFVDRCLKTLEAYEEFCVILDRAGLTNLAVTVTRMCQIFLGLDQNISWCESANDNLCRQLMEFVLNQGNFGRKKNDEKVIKVLTRYNNPTVFFGKLQENGLFLWPAAKKNLFLRPFAWIFAGIKVATEQLHPSSPGQKRFSENILESMRRREMFDRIYGKDYRKKVACSGNNTWRSPFERRLKKLYYWVRKTPLRFPLYYLNELYYICRYWFYPKPMISVEDRENVARNVTFIFKSFNRPMKAARLYKSIKQYYPGARVVIADDSEKPLVIHNMDKGDEIIRLPFNSGLSKGIIEALSRVETPYVMRMDDDVLLIPSTDVCKELAFLQKYKEADLTSFQLTHRAPKRMAEYYSRIKMNRKLIIPAGSFIDGHEVVYKTANIFLTRTESLRKVGYDPKIRMIDHHEFFFRAAGEIVCVQDPKNYIMHCHNYFEKEKYLKHRNDIEGDIEYIMQKHGASYG